MNITCQHPNANAGHQTIHSATALIYPEVREIVYSDNIRGLLGVRWQATRDTALACAEKGADSQSAVAAALCRRTPWTKPYSIHSNPV
jgi:hypothetical protein